MYCLSELYLTVVYGSEKVLASKIVHSIEQRLFASKEHKNHYLLLKEHKKRNRLEKNFVSREHTKKRNQKRTFGTTVILYILLFVVIFNQPFFILNPNSNITILVMNRFEKIVSGNFNQACPNIFGYSAGKQCSCITLTSVCWTTVRKITLWKDFDLDFILHKGDKVYKDVNINRYLNVDELPTKIVIDNSHFDIFVIRAEDFLGSSLLEDTDTIINTDLFFSDNVTGIILFIEGYCVSILKESNNCQVIYAFDSHSRDSEGNIVPDGSSILIKFSSIKSFWDYIVLTYGSSSCQLVYIKTIPEENKTDTEKSLVKFRRSKLYYENSKNKVVSRKESSRKFNRKILLILKLIEKGVIRKMRNKKKKVKSNTIKITLNKKKKAKSDTIKITLNKKKKAKSDTIKITLNKKKKAKSDTIKITLNKKKKAKSDTIKITLNKKKTAEKNTTYIILQKKMKYVRSVIEKMLNKKKKAEVNVIKQKS